MENEIIEKKESLEDINSDIVGWGVDADPENDPTYPMKKRTNEEHQGYSWDRPPQQPINIEILHSNERPNVSATFGTSSPLSGVSGEIRRYAFKYSENDNRHWLGLLLADRVNVVEGIVDDLSKGHIPNYFAERGWKAGMKHHPEEIVKKILVTALVTTVVVSWFFSSSGSKKPKLGKLLKR
ncbi:MAG: hypothetical protein JWN56_415 [Sphingobacteriales bacterium]|nr:hypothetical protein [Sphingobacteriales bacterium]